MKRISLNLGVVLILIGFSFSCNKKEEIKTEKQFNWYEISISNTFEEIIFYNDEDTATYEKRIFEGNIFTGGTKYLRTDHKTLNFNKSERDSVFKYVFEIIKNPINTETECSDYVGNLTLKIENEYSQLSAKYRSICAWDTLSVDTQKLYELLNTKINFSNR